MKVALVTGGASGIGRATVKRLLNAGCRAGFLDFDEVRSAELVGEIDSGDLVYVPGDVRNPADIGRAVETITKRLGLLTTVITCAGVHARNTIDDFTEAEWTRIFDTNVKGTVYAIRHSIPSLEASRSGAMVLVAADQALIGKRGTFVYGASKGAIAQMTRSLALELAGKNIRVNAVCPGTIRTPLAGRVIDEWAKKEFGGDSEQAWRAVAANYPLGRVGTAEEVAELINFLASDASGFITGGLFPIDGGLTCGLA